MIPRVASRGARTDADGTVFDSASELRRWRELKLLESVGTISELRRQVIFRLYGARLLDGLTQPCSVPIKIRSPRYENGRECVWTADFAYFENGVQVFEEYKGVWTEAARLRIAIAEACYGIIVRITGPAVMRKSARRLPESIV